MARKQAGNGEVSAAAPHRQITQAGLDLIKSFEGYHKTVKGSTDCVAYLCPARVWTIGYGCTEGVEPGMRWTHAEAETALRRELDKHERAVMRLVTVDLNDPRFDALVSFSYNVGSGALSKSTLLRKLNAGDYVGAEREFGKWTKGGGRVLKGLVRRRKAEALMFGSTPPSDEPDMPQAVEEITVQEVDAASAKAKTAERAKTWTTIGVAVGVAGETVNQAPSIAEQLSVTSETLTHVKSITGTVGSLFAEWWIVGVVVVGLVGFLAFDWIKKRGERDFEDGRYMPSGIEQ